MPDKQQILKEINEVSFALIDVGLYLDTHPTDQEALSFFQSCKERRKLALEEFEKSFYPLTMDCIRAENEQAANNDTKYAGFSHWTWVDGPAPWEGGC